MAIAVFHLISSIVWFFGQTLAVVDYDMVAGWGAGLQAPRSVIDPVLVEVNRGIGLTDTIVMLPLHVLAAVGLLRMRFYGAVLSWMVFGITLYWPTMFLASKPFFAEAGIADAPLAASDVVVLSVVIGIAVWGSWYLFRKRAQFR